MRISDWSSDVCSSDLVTGGDRPLPSLPPSTAGLAVRQTPFPEPAVETAYPTGLAARPAIVDQLRRPLGSLPEADRAFRSEERRVGQACVSPFKYRWSPLH